MLIFSKLKQKSLFFKLMISITTFCFIIVLSITLVYTDVYVKSMNQQFMDENLKSLQRLNNDFDNQLKQIHQLSVFLIQNFDVYEFLNMKSYDSDVSSRASKYSKLTRNMNDYLYSIILYNKNIDDYILAGSSQIDIGQFMNHTLYGPNVKSSIHIVYSSINPSSAYSKNPPLPTLSLIFQENISSDNFLNRAIIMNLDTIKISKNFLGKYEGLTIITDNSGKVLFNTFNYQTDKYVIKTKYFKKILEDYHFEGSFQMKLENDNKIISFVKSSYSDFYIINIKSSKDLLSAIKEKRNFFIILSIIALLLFFILAYMISKKIYSPIKKITEIFSRSRFGNTNENVNEIAAISYVFKETVDFMEDLERQNEDKNIRLKEEYLRKILILCKTSEIDIENFSKYNLKVEFNNLFIISIKMDNFLQTNEKQHHQFNASVLKTYPDILNDKFNFEILSMLDGELALLLNFKDTAKNDFQELITTLEAAKKAVFCYTGITATIGIGGVVNNAADCENNYNKASDLIKYRFLAGFDRIIYQAYIDEHFLTNLNYPKEIEDSLISSIKQTRKDEFENNLDNFIVLLKNYLYSESIQIFFQVTVKCLNTINLVASQENSKFNLKLDDFSKIFTGLQTIDQTKEWLLGVFSEYEKIIDNISKLKSSKHYEMVTIAHNYIKEQYSNINLTVEAIAETMGYTPYYFTKIYKEITGVNINDYIRQVRIEKAKEFLDNTSLKINDIPLKVGFSSTSYFCSAFKKDVGLTPSIYREYKARGMQDN